MNYLQKKTNVSLLDASTNKQLLQMLKSRNKIWSSRKQNPYLK